MKGTCRQVTRSLPDEQDMHDEDAKKRWLSMLEDLGLPSQPEAVSASPPTAPPAPPEPPPTVAALWDDAQVAAEEPAAPANSRRHQTAGRGTRERRERGGKGGKGDADLSRTERSASPFHGP